MRSIQASAVVKKMCYELKKNVVQTTLTHLSHKIKLLLVLKRDNRVPVF
jgi:hypothetical protein